MAKKTIRVPVSGRALIQRINRKLSSKGQRLKQARGAAIMRMGSFFLIDVDKNEVVERRVRLDKLGRKLGVLAPYEEVKGV